MSVEKLLLIILFIAVSYYPLCGIIGLIRYIRGEELSEELRGKKMTIEDAIKHEEVLAKELDKLCKRYDDASGYTRSHNEDIRTTGAKKCAECAKEHRQLAEWLKDYKRLLEQKNCEDDISRQAVFEMAYDMSEIDGEHFTKPWMVVDVEDIQKLPSVKPQEPKWIPIKTRPLTDKEKEEYAYLGYSEEELCFMYDCLMPEDGEEVLITTRYDEVKTDTFYRDEGGYFESYCDEDDIKAWMPLPKPYEPQERSNKE